jgi:hypothetical protein
MKKLIAVPLILAVVSINLASAEPRLGDAEFIARARTLSEALKRPFGGHAQIPANGSYETDRVEVDDDQGGVFIFSKAGEFLSFAESDPHMLRDVTNHDAFSSDTKVWEATDAYIRCLAVPTGLERGALKRTDGVGGELPVIRVEYHPKPFGFPAPTGNQVFFTLKRGVGTPIRIFVGRGWAYETPNIQIDEGQAKAAAVKAWGGVEGDWKVQLEYSMATVPSLSPTMDALSDKKVQRLCYNVWGSRGAVLVDSVTGEVIWSNANAVDSSSSIQGDTGKPQAISVARASASTGLGLRPASLDLKLPLCLSGILIGGASSSYGCVEVEGLTANPAAVDPLTPLVLQRACEPDRPERVRLSLPGYRHP